jgi:outer membrane immunogenic protein
MKAVLLAGTAAFLSGSAFAADLPARMPVKAKIAAAPYSWTGCYVGGHAGVGWGHSSISDPNAGAPGFGFSITPTPGDTIGMNGVGAVVGGQVGCDYQFQSNWVVGLAGDFSWANIDASETDPFFNGKNGPIPMHAKTDFLATATGRLGYAWDRYLLYAKGGAAWTHNKYNFDNLANFGNSFCVGGVGCFVTASETRLGWTAGAGFEWAFANSWSAFAEFDYYSFPNHGVTFTTQVGGSGPYNVNQNIEVAKIGINYRFGARLH